MKADNLTTDFEGEPENPLRPVFTTFTNPSRNEVCSTVIIGAGIIGCATAHYLSRSGNTRPDTIHLVEASEELFASASGKAGGFVAEDWFGAATGSLGELSFRLHGELAEENNGGREWGFSRTTGVGFQGDGGTTNTGTGGDWLSTGGSRAESASHEFFSDYSAPSWLRKRKGDSVSSLTEHGGAAQVDPLRLSKFLLRQSIAAGVRLHHPARPIRLALDDSNHLSGLRIRHSSGSEYKIPCTRLLITAGAWTPKVFSELFPTATVRIPVTPYAGHSIVLRSPRWKSKQDECHALFTTLRGTGFSPEIFARMENEVYIAGLNSSDVVLPDLPSDAEVDKEAIAELMKVGKRLLGREGESISDLELVREGLCFRPVTGSGTPILARVEDEKLSAGGDVSTLEGSNGGVFVCAGHGPWGISHSLGTGKVMSEMLEKKGLSADVRMLGL